MTCCDQTMHASSRKFCNSVTTDRSAVATGERSGAHMELASERTPVSSQGWLTLLIQALSGEPSAECAPRSP